MLPNSSDPVKMPRYVAFYLGHHYLSMPANIQTSLSANQCSRTKYFTATCADPEGGYRGSGPPGNYKNIGFLCNTGLDPLKITKLPSQHSMLGHYRHASEMPFKMAFRWWAFDCPLTHLDPSSPHQTKNKVRPPLTKLSGSAHVLTDTSYAIR